MNKFIYKNIIESFNLSNNNHFLRTSGTYTVTASYSIFIIFTVKNILEVFRNILKLAINTLDHGKHTGGITWVIHNAQFAKRILNNFLDITANLFNKLLFSLLNHTADGEAPKCSIKNLLPSILGTLRNVDRNFNTFVHIPVVINRNRFPVNKLADSDGRVHLSDIANPIRKSFN